MVLRRGLCNWVFGLLAMVLWGSSVAARADGTSESRVVVQGQEEAPDESVDSSLAMEIVTAAVQEWRSRYADSMSADACLYTVIITTSMWPRAPDVQVVYFPSEEEAETFIESVRQVLVDRYTQARFRGDRAKAEAFVTRIVTFDIIPPFDC